MIINGEQYRQLISDRDMKIIVHGHRLHAEAIRKFAKTFEKEMKCLKLRQR